MRKAALKKLLQLAKEDRRILLVASDVSSDVIGEFQREVPDQLLLEGIAEAHAIGMSAGLALQGSIVFANTIASFLTKRAFEQIAINLCLENANVKLLGQGGGLVYGPQGPTHHALEDIAILRTLPNMKIFVPCDVRQAERAVSLAAQIDGPCYIRLAKGSARTVSAGHDFRVGQPIVHIKPKHILLICSGIMTQTAIEVAEKIDGCGVVQVFMMKPFCYEELGPYLDGVQFVATIEEHSRIGGLASCVSETIVQHCVSKPKFHSFSLGDDFIRTYGKQEALLSAHGLDAAGITGKLCELLGPIQ
jgi:transketolase